MSVLLTNRSGTPVLQSQLESDPVSCAGLLRGASAPVAQWVACLHYGAVWKPISRYRLSFPTLPFCLIEYLKVSLRGFGTNCPP